jgi:hypothetical protein
MSAALIVIGWALLLADIACLLRGYRRRLLPALGFLTLAAANALARDWLFAGLDGALAVWFGVQWWRGGGGGHTKRAARELGAKSRARVDALVRQMTPSPIPSPAGA